MEMDDPMVQDTLKIAGQVIVKPTEAVRYTNLWMWLSIAEFGVVLILILKNKLKQRNIETGRFKEESLRQNIDFDNIINSSFNSGKIYNELKTRCHPDRFPVDKEKRTIAENLFQEIAENKNNVKRLIELREEAKDKLDLIF